MNTKQSMPHEVHLDEREAATEGRLRAALSEAYPAVQPSPQLRARVAEMAAAHAVRAARQRTLRLRLRAGMGLAGAAALLALMVAVWPRVVLAQMLRRMDAAMSGVQSAHMIMWRVAEDGSRSKESENWYQGGRWRLEQWPSQNVIERRTTQIFSEGRLWSYEPDFNKVTVRRAKGMFGHEPSGFNGAAFIEDFERASMGQVNVDISDAVLRGRAARRIHIQNSNDLEATDITLLTDAATDLPIEAQMEVTARSGRRLQRFIEFRFDEPLSARLFEPKFPATARVVDVDKGKAEWRQRLAKGIARQKVGERTIIIRDLQVNERGHVFLLYTAGRPFLGERFAEFQKSFMDTPDWDVELHDDKGVEYSLSRIEGLAPTVESSAKFDNPPPNGFIFNGQKLEGAWWVPEEPQQPWQPRRFIITFKINPRTWQGVRIARREGSLIMGAAQSQARRALMFALPVRRPGCAFVPDYMPFMAPGNGPRDAGQILRAEADASGESLVKEESSPHLIRAWRIGEKHSVSALAFSPNGQTVASAVWGVGIKLWDAQTGKRLQTLRPRQDENEGVDAVWSALAFSPNGERLAAASHRDGTERAGELQLWNAGENKLLWSVVAPDGLAPFSSLRFSPDAKTVLGLATRQNGHSQRDVRRAAATDVLLCAWDASTGKLRQTQTIYRGNSVQTAVLLPDGRRLAVSTSQRENNGFTRGSKVLLWDVQTQRALGTFSAEGRFDVSSLAVSDNGRMLAAGGSVLGIMHGEKNVIVGARMLRWDVATGRFIQALDTNGYTLRIVFSPDGMALASGDDMGIIKLWRVE